MRIRLIQIMALAALATVLPRAITAQEVDVFVYSKHDGIEQTGDHAQSIGWTWCDVYATFLDSIASRVNNVQLYWPDGHAAAIPRISPTEFEAGAYFGTPAEREQAYPDGYYRVRINDGGTLAASLWLMTKPAPVMRIANFAELQTASDRITVRWDAIPGATANDQIDLRIERADGTVVYEASATPGAIKATDTSFLVPVDLPPAEDLTCYLDYLQNTAALADNGFTYLYTIRGASLRFNARYTPPPPSIATAPQPRSVGIGRSAGFAVAASGVGLTYQWLHDGVEIPGAVSSSFTIAAVQARDAGEYSVRVSNSSGVLTSDPARLSVAPALAITTWFSTAPGSSAVDGPPGTGRLNPRSVPGLIAAPGGILYLTDNYAVRKIAADGTLSTLAGSLSESGTADGSGAGARFGSLRGLTIAPDGALIVCDYGNGWLRRVTRDGAVTTCQETLAGGGQQPAVFSRVVDVKCNAGGDAWVVTETDVWKLTVAGVRLRVATGFTAATGAALTPDGSLYVLESSRVWQIAPNGEPRNISDGNGSPGSDGRVFYATAITRDADGVLYFTNTDAVNRLTPGGWINVMAGGDVDKADGVGPAAGFHRASALALADDGKFHVLDYNAGNDSFRVRIGVLQAGAPAPGAGPAPFVATVAPGGMVVRPAPDGGASADYQWFRDGMPLAGQTSRNLVVAAAQAGDEGAYSVRVINIAGAASFAAGSLTVVAAGTVPSRIMNLSIRTNAGAGDKILIAGFVVGGNSGRSVPLLIRGIGPALGAFGLTDYLRDPVVTLFNSAQKAVAENDNWGGDGDVVAAAARVGAFSLSPTSSRDAAMLPWVPGGSAYTVQVRGADGGTGTALMEVYNAIEETPTAATPRLFNVSARADVQPGDGVLIAGFVVGGGLSKTVLVRGVGPTLASYRVSNPLADPQLEIHGDAGVVAKNDDWGGAARVAAAAAQVGAFKLGAASKDAALLITLEPGVYSALVRGANGATGVGLVEVYEVP